MSVNKLRLDGDHHNRSHGVRAHQVHGLLSLFEHCLGGGDVSHNARASQTKQAQLKEKINKLTKGEISDKEVKDKLKIDSSEEGNNLEEAKKALDLSQTGVKNMNDKYVFKLYFYRKLVLVLSLELDCGIND